MVTYLKTFKDVKLNNPILIEGLPGIGNVGKVVVEYMIEKLGAQKLGELYSSHFPYHVFVNEDDTVQLPTNLFYYWKKKKKNQRDIILLTGDIQSITPEGHYEIGSKIIDFIKEYGSKEIITIGGFGLQKMPKKPKVIGAVTEKKLKTRLKKAGVDFSGGSRIGFIVGASGLLLGLGKLEGMNGYCLMGETISTQPFFTDSTAAKSVLTVLNKVLHLNIDMDELSEMSGEMEKAIDKAKEIQQRIADEMSFSTGAEELRYIG